MRVERDFPLVPERSVAPLRRYTPVLIRWTDAWFDAEQSDPDAWRHIYVVETVGFVAREADGVVSVASEVLPDGDGFRAVTHIPAKIILERVELVAKD